MRRLRSGPGSGSGSGWDAIVIGAGLGGLSTAAYLTTNGVRTIVVEQYDVAGGCSHVFRRKRLFEFDVGVHYLGDCQPAGIIPTVLRGVGLDAKIEFLEMDPDGFDTLVFPELTFRVPRGWEHYLQRLTDAFPSERAGLRKCVKVLATVGHQVWQRAAPATKLGMLPYALKAPATARWGLRPLVELYDACKLSPAARAVIAGQSGTYAAPPSRVAVSVHAGLLHHYIGGGAYYPRGGGQVLAAHLVDVICSHGGQIRTGARVERILMAAGRVAGVALRDGQRLTAPVVVSGADLKRTYLELVGREHLAAKTVGRVQGYRMALPLHCVYLGLDIDLAQRMPNTNYWCHPTLDSEAIYQRCYAGQLPDELLAYITSASVKDPFSAHIAPPGGSSMEIMTVVPPDYRLWGVTDGPAAGERYRRLADYRAIKGEITEALIERAGRVIPGLGEHIVWREGATPITQERYTLSSGGACYGLEHAPDQVGPRRPGPKTAIRGLYLAGHSTLRSYGVAGAMLGGVDAAGAVVGRDLGAEVRAGRVFGDPSRLTAGGPGWDALEASRRLGGKPAPTNREPAPLA
ncbi:MAG: phytoene desaturase family protein [Egibacteraceae bacterium]